MLAYTVYRLNAKADNNTHFNLRQYSALPDFIDAIKAGFYSPVHVGMAEKMCPETVFDGINLGDIETVSGYMTVSDYIQWADGTIDFCQSEGWIGSHVNRI